MEETCSDFENLYYNLEAGIPTDEDISKCQQSIEDLYEEIQFPERLESQWSETATENTSMKPKTSCHVIETVTTDTQGLAIKERIVAKEDTEKTVGRGYTEVEYGNIFVVPGEGFKFTNEEPEERDPKTEASQKVSGKVSLKLKRKLTQRVKERNLDQRIVKVGTNSME